MGHSSQGREQKECRHGGVLLSVLSRCSKQCTHFCCRARMSALCRSFVNSSEAGEMKHRPDLLLLSEILCLET